MPITKEDLHLALSSHFSDADITIVDLAGDDDHWQVSICSKEFLGKSRIAQHKMVQDAVKNYNIHALAIKTKTQNI